jgi:tetratricopeptide (TPR) repeat protein
MEKASRAGCRTRRVALRLVLSGLAGGLGWLWWSSTSSSSVNFLPRLGGAEWIAYPRPQNGKLNPRVELATAFRRVFNLNQVPSKAALQVTGFHRYVLCVNDEVVQPPPRLDRNWKHADRLDISRYLHPGENQINVAVFNANGPPALWLRLATDGMVLASDSSWEASCAGAVWRRACLARQPKEFSAGGPLDGGARPWPSLQKRWPILLLFAAVSAVGYWLAGAGRGAWRHGPAQAGGGGSSRELLLLGGLAALWVALFLHNLPALPALVGFDVEGHLAYIHYIQVHSALPLANQGWESFQPPLYYLLCAALLKLLSLSVTDAHGVMALRVLGLGIGVVHFTLAWAALRLLFPGQLARQRWGVVLAGCLPPVLYLSQYITNEGLAAGLVTACVWLCLRLLRQDRASWKQYASLGLCLGAALLAKSTALLILPPTLGALVWKWLDSVYGPKPQGAGVQAVAEDGQSWRRLVGQCALVMAVCAVVCGWHYGRTWAHFGTPLLGGWDPRTGASWWQDDGYRTSAFYLRFGAALYYPWFSAFKSFADGIYTTLWGESLFGGMAEFGLGLPPWNYDLMAIGYWLALVPTLAALIGGILALLRFLRQPTAEWFLVLGLGFLVVLAVVHVSLAVPYYCTVKAFYGLSGLLPLCACVAWGLDWLSRAVPKLRPVLCVLLAVWALNSLASFWVSPSSTATLLSNVKSSMLEGRIAEATERLKARVQAGGAEPEVRAVLADFEATSGRESEAVQQAEAAIAQKPNSRLARLVLEQALARQQRIPEATALGRKLIESAPGYEAAYRDLALLLVNQGEYEETERVAREGLGLAPFSAELRLALGAALLARSETAEAPVQIHLAFSLKPRWLEGRCTLAALLTQQGRLEEAAAQYAEALRLTPSNTNLRVSFGTVLARLGKWDEATNQFSAAVSSQPKNPLLYCQVAAALNSLHRTKEAIASYTEALRLQPDLSDALCQLAWIRAASSQAQFRDGAEAVRLAERACELTGYKEPLRVGILAAAYAEAGKFDQAVAMAGKARELALASGQTELAEQNRQRIALFTARQPYREVIQRAGPH